MGRHLGPGTELEFYSLTSLSLGLLIYKIGIEQNHLQGTVLVK